MLTVMRRLFAGRLLAALAPQTALAPQSASCRVPATRPPPG